MPAAAQAERLIIEDPTDHTPGVGPAASAARTPSGETVAAMVVEWRAALAAATAAAARLDLIVGEAAKLYLPRPAGGLYGPFRFSDDERAAAAWWRQAKAVDALCEAPPAEMANDAAWVVVEGIAKRILAVRPSTAREAADKFGVVLEWAKDGQGGLDDPQPVFDFMADLQHLAELEKACQQT